MRRIPLREQRGHSARPPRVRLLALMNGCSALGALLSALVPMTPHAPVVLLQWLAVAGATLTALVWWVPRPAVLHLALLAHLACLGALVAHAASGAGAAAASIGYVWVALYAAFFFGRRVSRAYSALAAVSLLTALVVNPFPGAGHTWCMVVATTVVATEAVARVVEQLERAAATDPLTGVLNRDGLRVAGTAALAYAVRRGHPLTAAVIDLDGFKLVNDRDGHAAGDRLLVALVRAWQTHTRDADVLARTGGDEFVVLLPDTEVEQTAALLERLRRDSPAAWSVGLATATPSDDLEGLLQRADRDLYVAKSRRAAAPGAVLPAQRQPGMLERCERPAPWCGDRPLVRD